MTGVAGPGATSATVSSTAPPSQPEDPLTQFEVDYRGQEFENGFLVKSGGSLLHEIHS